MGFGKEMMNYLQVVRVLIYYNSMVEVDRPEVETPVNSMIRRNRRH